MSDNEPREFSRRVNIQIIKDEPQTREEFFANWPVVEIDPDYEAATEKVYQAYLDRFQPYRWRAVAANNEPVAHGESYFNEAGAINAAELLCGDDSTVYLMPMYGEDRSERLLRYGKTDRDSQAAQE